MNNTQKSAWFNLVTLVICSLSTAVFLIERVVMGRKAGLWRSVHILMPLIMAITLFILVRKRQSRLEVPVDERDKLIKKKALIISYFTVWILLIASFIISCIVVGPKGSVPIMTLAYMLCFVFYISTLVYLATILIQYRLGGNENE